MSSPSNSRFERNRLPNLWEVLSRTTRAPVDLYSFYIYMRDTQRAVDYLDFWLDVSQHMSLCRHYVRGLRRSVLVDTPEMGSKRSSAVLRDEQAMQQSQYHNDFFRDRDDSVAGPSTYERKTTNDQRLSAFLRENGTRHSPTNSRGSNQESPNEHTPGSEAPPRPSFMTGSASNSPANDSSQSPGTSVARADIRASAEKILYTYLLAGSEREIILPVGILDDITTAIERDGRDDPEVFDAAKDYVFQAMERDAFPGFLRQKALGNIVHPSMLLRLIIGLVTLFAALWTAFILIFLDYSRKTRCWLILPFTVGIYFLVSHQYMLDPILALLGFSEYTIMDFQRVKEPFVRRLLNKRAVMCLGVIFLVTAALCLIFILVPGKRL
ncbi:regulator of G protein signaling superfamily [Myriangium duriaei CBS 260.36]|uniref:Regulator of G protein signaling superfamily n=1 Tax=Myriangium duriaei CBS 260.36 TaxID=1168546 RepID=A0A9P4IWV3_9PEZI|nr:regulator of G protein signaling superfamily [Myriangium duriaei CBS 260.36]